MSATRHRFFRDVFRSGLLEACLAVVLAVLGVFYVAFWAVVTGLCAAAVAWLFGAEAHGIAVVAAWCAVPVFGLIYTVGVSMYRRK